MVAEMILSGYLMTTDHQKIHYDHYKNGHKEVVIIAHGFFNSKQAVLLKNLSKDLSDEQKKIVQDNLSFVAQLATRLDKTGDANDKEGTQANWDKLQKIITQLRALYQTSESKD